MRFMDCKKYKISVAVCTYNGARYIEEQLRSILEQSCKVDEIVLGDDGSTDNTLECAREILEQSGVEYRIFKNENNLGFRKNFEKTIGNTTGDIIFLCDQDDVWVKDKVEIMMRHFIDNSKCLLVFSDGEVVDTNLNMQSMSLWKSFLLDKALAQTTDWKYIFLKGWYVTGAATAIKRELFEACCPFSDICVHDAWLAMNAALQKQIEMEPQKLIKYRQHGSNQIGVPASLMARIRNKIKIIRNLMDLQKTEHSRKALMYKDIYSQFHDWIVDDKEYEEEILRCIKFHEEMTLLRKNGFIHRLFKVIKSKINKDYKKYAKNNGMFYMDMLCAMFCGRLK